MRQSIVRAALLAAVLVPSSLVAQVVQVGQPGARTTSSQRWYRGGANYSNPYGRWGGYGAGMGGNTVGGARMGAAEVIRAGGEAAESYTNAAINYEEARSRFIDNKQKWAEVYWQRRRLNEAEQAKDDEADRARRDAWRNNRSRSSETALNPSQLDPSTGKIYWPTVLQGAEYYNHRQKMDELFVLRAHTETYPGLSTDIARTAEAIKGQLKEHIRDYPPHQYLEARKFVDGLALATRYD